MKDKRKFMLCLSILILLMGVGFAFLSTEVNIFGRATVSGNNFNVHYTNAIVKEGSITTTKPEIKNATELDFTVVLEKPGDFYEFTVDVVNSGTVDAIIEKLETTGFDDQTGFLIYSIAWADGNEIKPNQLLKVDEVDTIKVKVEYNKDITDEELNAAFESNNRSIEVKMLGNDLNYNYQVSTPYIQDDGKGFDRHRPLYDIMDEVAISDININVKNASPNNSENRGGVGVFRLNSTENDSNPILYFRGDVTNNNVMFAGKCWKIIRTTEEGGTKIIYNGNPQDNGSCNNTGTNSWLPSRSYYANSSSTEDYLYKRNGKGVSYSMRYPKSDTSFSYYFGTSYNYNESTKTYTINEPILITSSSWSSNSVKVSTYRYFCIERNATTCTRIGVTTRSLSDSFTYMTMEGVATAQEAIDAPLVGANNNSPIKTAVDNFYNTYLKDYDAYILDEGYCNNTTGTGDFYGTSFNGSIIWFNGYYMLISSNQPTLSCRNINKFTISKDHGNGLGNTKSGLITADEAVYAGLSGSGTGNYLASSGYGYWTMSPAQYSQFDPYSSVMYISDRLMAGGTSGSKGVRPVITLDGSLKVRSGDGSFDSPYELIIN